MLGGVVVSQEFCHPKLHNRHFTPYHNLYKKVKGFFVIFAFYYQT